VLNNCNQIISSSIRTDFAGFENIAIDSLPKGYLKAHLSNGYLYLINPGWDVDSSGLYIIGNSSAYDFNRKFLGTSYRKILIDSIVIAESNMPVENRDKKKISVLTVVSIVDGAMLAFCIALPKACYGSCPTFYYEDNNDLKQTNGEGFSAAVLPCLEEADIDALQNPSFSGSEVSLTMKNEAYETHAVNEVKLLAVKREPNENVFQDPQNNFYVCGNLIAVQSATASEGDIKELVLNMDEKERYSFTDTDQLKTNETVDFTFKNELRDSSLGFVLNFRQTLASTFVFYSFLSYMGTDAGEYYSRIERSDYLATQVKKRLTALSQIEVYAYSDQKRKWILINKFEETGPIAKNLQMVKIPFECASQKEVKIRLKSYQGFFRFDFAALTHIKHTAVPIEMLPNQILYDMVNDDEAVDLLNKDDDKYLCSLPGDIWKMNFKIPEVEQGNDFAFFVVSKGYYLEWFRENWLREKNPEKLRGIVIHDKKTWEQLSREFKAVEAEMESNFWTSSVSM
ncbi:MAG: hypothetical protein ACHQFW_05565, partial [Chitinophagales bacterium]